jgi:hypothetical protein
MLARHSQFVLVLLVMAFLCLPAQGWGQNSQGQEAAASATSALPAELAQIPAGTSDVTYLNGQLTIKAHNAPLMEVVRMVCSQIGAELDAKSEPRGSVVGIMGPGSAKEVLTSLLNDSHVNYALGGTADDPNVLASVIIFSENRDSSVRKQVAEQPAGQAESGQPKETAAPPVTVRAAVTQTMALLDAARSDFANGVDAGEVTGAGGEKIDVGAFLQQIETQLKAVAADPNSAQPQQPTDPASAGPAPVLPAGRPMHRKHH